MNPTKRALAHAFIDIEPDAAARLLERQPPAQVAALIDGAPRPQALRAMNALLPAFAAQVLHELALDSTPTAAHLLAGLPPHRVAVLLRQLDPSEQETLLQPLPMKRRTTLRLLLNYGEEQVGAWMETDLPLLALRASVGDALAQLRRSDGDAESHLLFIVASGGRLVGCCSLQQLLRSETTTPLQQLLREGPLPLGGRTSLSAALSHPGWQQSDVVPVIDRQHHLLGVLSHHRLRTLLHAGGEQRQSSGRGDLALLVGEAYGASLRGLFGNFDDSATSANSAPTGRVS